MAEGPPAAADEMGPLWHSAVVCVVYADIILATFAALIWVVVSSRAPLPGSRYAPELLAGKNEPRRRLGVPASAC